MRRHHRSLSILVLILLTFVSTAAFARAGGGGGGGGGGGIFGIIALPFILIYMAYVNHKIHKKEKEVDVLLSKLEQTDPMWNEKELIKMASDKFLLLQKAWSEQNMEITRKNLSASLFQNWEDQINGQIERNEKNIVSGTVIKQIGIVDVETGANNNFTVCIDAQAYDQTYANGKVVASLSKNGAYREFWTFERANNDWLLKEVTQADGWKRFVNAHLAQ